MGACALFHFHPPPPRAPVAKKRLVRGSWQCNPQPPSPFVVQFCSLAALLAVRLDNPVPMVLAGRELFGPKHCNRFCVET